MNASALHTFFTQKTRDPRAQFLRYLFVGVASSVVDLGVYAALIRGFHINIFLAAFAGYTLGFVCNHLLSLMWVFESKHSRRKEVVMAYSIAIGGLLWTELLLWVFVHRFLWAPILSKIATQFIVLVWNFGMRKKFVFH
jgi:putative flippase GtrA